jgi:hypothetical protein
MRIKMLFSSNAIELRTGKCRTPPFIVLLLTGAFSLGNTTAEAGYNHARAVIGLGVSSQLKTDSQAADAQRHQVTKYRYAHEELGNNYTYGNAGSGHAHHHTNLLGLVSVGNEQKAASDQQPKNPPPRPGSRGSSQYVKQTWVPNGREKMDVAWSPDSFLQIDLTELSRNNIITSRASLAADGGLAGSVELSAWLDEKGMPQTNTRLSGIFKDAKSELVSHPGKIVSLHFRQPLSWTVPGTAETFDSALDGSIDIETRAQNSR